MSTIDSYAVISDGVVPNNDNPEPWMMPPTSPHSAPAAPPAPTYQAGGGDASALEAAAAAGQTAKRKRGRPRKYAIDGGGTMPPPEAAVFQSSGLSSPATPAAAKAKAKAAPSGKKPRGRPRGSGRKQQVDAFGSPGLGFTPHVITVKAGEDVSSKIMSFSQNGTRTICILSATGSISNVTLHQAATSGGTVTYEGRFEILSLSGSYMLLESGGQRSRTGGLSVLLAGPDGRVLGGSVAGVLTAAAPLQVVVGCFTSAQEDKKPPHQANPSTAPAKLVPRASAVASPASHANMSESSGGPGSPLNQSTGAYNNSNQQGMNTISWQ